MVKYILTHPHKHQCNTALDIACMTYARKRFQYKNSLNIVTAHVLVVD